MYENLSLIYDTYMGDVDYESWAKYLVDLINNVSKDYKTVLEYGCGTGNLTLPLTDYYDVTGVDLSDEMLTIAENKLRGKNVQLYKGDLKNFKYPTKVDLIILACDTLNLLNYDEIDKFFKRVYCQLEPGGLFLFDILSEEYLVDYIAKNNFIFNDDNTYFTWTSELSSDYLESYFTFFIKEGTYYRRVDDYQKQYILKPSKLLKILETTGFINIDVFDFLTKEKLINESDRIQFIAMKPFS